MTVAIQDRAAARVAAVRSRAYTFPTEEPESDGTLTWDSTTMIYAEIDAGGRTGIGYTYADAAAAGLISGMLAEALVGSDAMQTGACAAKLWAKIRNNGRCGVAAMAVSALDVALWDLKGKLLDVPVCTLLGQVRDQVPLYGSGGFTSYGLKELARHMARWVDEDEIPRVKMKVGRDHSCDRERVGTVRKAIGNDAQLFVDANGGYAVKEALAIAAQFAQAGVVWFEEPVDHRDLAGNARVRAMAPPSMEVSNGEYGYALDDFERMISMQAADVLQADVTRCGGFTGFMAVDALCHSRNIPLSSHCAPYATLHAAAAATSLRHAEYFYDHERIERRFFDGADSPRDGALAPDLSRPGIGLTFKAVDAIEFAV
ncbi:MAG TPA: enolase C-terminal domain-like protein [Candidatus Cybelea sp.]|jgi:L-alanine-DL-glutamate epimerase-like enolase superfamily enzyme|nr:enolase C-terminal domain-like protein [Candidatus Cybelea sp.]